MSFAARPRKEIGNDLHQRGQRSPVFAEPGEQHDAQQQKCDCRGQHRFSAATSGEGPFPHVPESQNTNAAAAMAKK